MIRQELGIAVDLDDFRLDQLLPDADVRGHIHYFHWQDFMPRWRAARPHRRHGDLPLQWHDVSASLPAPRAT